MVDVTARVAKVGGVYPLPELRCKNNSDSYAA